MKHGPALISADHLERLAFDHGQRIEFHDGRAYLTHQGVTFYAVLAPVGGAA